MAIRSGDDLLVHLLGHAGWARRLARQLVGDGEGDDLVQDALLAGRNARVDAGSSLRPWLATVLRNLGHNRRLAEERRRRREAEVAQTGQEAVGAEQALVALELQQRLAAAVAALPPEDRRIVVLRYYEERTSAQIADELGVPAATVRWRLTGILERLRRALDEAYGERRAWALVLVGGGQPGRAGAKARTWGVAAAAACGAALVGTFALRETSVRERHAHAEIASGLRTGEPGSGSSPGASSVATLAALDGRSLLDACLVRLREAEARHARLFQQLRQWERPEPFFAASTRSREAEAEIGPFLAPLLSREREDAFECHQWMCKLTLRRPVDFDWGPGLAKEMAQVREDLGERLEKIGGGSDFTMRRNWTTGVLERELTYFLWLQSADGSAPVTRSGAQATAGSHDLASCTAALAELEASAQALEPRVTGALPPDARFAQGQTRVHDAEREMRADLDAALGPDAGAVEVECREDVCRLQLLTNDAGANLDWEELSRRLHSNANWRARHQGGWWIGANGERYMSKAAEPSEAERAAAEAYQALARKVGGLPGPLLRACSNGATLEKGSTALISVYVPPTGELNEDGEYDLMSVRLRGTLADTPAGRCALARLQAAARTIPLPSPIARGGAQYNMGWNGNPM